MKLCWGKQRLFISLSLTFPRLYLNYLDNLSQAIAAEERKAGICVTINHHPLVVLLVDEGGVYSRWHSIRHVLPFIDFSKKRTRAR